MCIVCEIRNKLGSEVANEEVVSFIMERVEMMAACLNGAVEEGREVIERRRVNRQAFGEILSLSSALFSDDDEAVARRNAKMAEVKAKSEAIDNAIDKLSDLLSFALLGRTARGMRAGASVDPRKPDGLPNEVWDAMPEELRAMLEGAEVLSVDSHLPSDLLAALFGKGNEPTKH